MTKGKIVLVPFPFDDLTAEKVRPALCLTDPIGTHRHVIVAFISSQVAISLSATDIILDSRREDFAATGLRVPSVIRLHRVVTLTSALIRRELGQLSPKLQSEVDKKLTALFALKAS
ncbi:MAG TPA: type II toxin-antitoxin system PemK/MazF family toxin [Verrucomicrobiae bacterium]|jgi:mRNA interferase MazF